MSDAPGQSEQEQPQEQKQAPKWGDSISPERQAELQSYIDRWAAETDHGERKGPFDKEPGARNGFALTGADTYWLAEQSGPDELGRVPNLHLEGAYLRAAHLEGAILREAHLEGAYLRAAHLEGANLRWAHLEGAYLRAAHLEESTLILTHLERATLTLAHLDRATLIATFFDKYSLLNDAILTGVSLDQVSFDQTNLTVVNWSLVTTLGDDQTALAPRDTNGKPKTHDTRLGEYRAAVRANRLLAVSLRNQGMNEDADRFAYRAQVLQQQVLLRQRKFGAYLFARFIDGLAGYGYKPVRSLIAYLVLVLGFAAGYYTLGQTAGPHLQWYEALVVSLTAFHGRGFFSQQFSPGAPQSILAAAEAVVGLIIEISFIATFTQRFLGK
jgi:hypothetical protein